MFYCETNIECHCTEADEFLLSLYFVIINEKVRHSTLIYLFFTFFKIIAPGAVARLSPDL